MLRMSSVFPPDSPTAWASLFTGLNPAKHGVISFKDPLSHSKVGEYLNFSRNIVGDTFWDLAGKVNKKCCIIFPHLAYPPWKVNGILVSRTTEVDIQKFDIKTYPPNLPLGIDAAELKPMTSFSIDPGEIVQPTQRLIMNEVEFGIHLLKNYDWDVFFIFFSSLDNIEHVFWSFFDERDPDYERGNPYKQIIPHFYSFYDKNVIGRFTAALGDYDILIVCSDHGHAIRPFKVIHVNELLARTGLLKTKTRSKGLFEVEYLPELVKIELARFISENRLLAKFVSRILSLFPRSLELYTTLSSIEWGGTAAYLSDSSAGVKSYSYAGIRINRDVVSSSSYEEIRQSIMNILIDIKDPKSSEPLIEWTMRREELYGGPFLHSYPDILFKLRNDWGAGWEINGPLFGRSPSHKLFPGSHRRESAVFLLSSPEELNVQPKEVMITDIAPTIMDILGFKNLFSSRFDGKSLL